MSFLIRSAADQSAPDRLIAAPRSINFCPPQDRVFIFCSIGLRENGFNTNLPVISFNYTPEVSHATSCHGRSQGFHFFQHYPERERFWHKCYCYLIIHLKYHMLDLVTDAVRVFIFSSIASRENGFDTSVTYCYVIIYLKYHILHLVTDAVRVFIFSSIAQRENGFDTNITVIWFNYIPEVLHATSCHGRSQGFSFFAALP